MKRLESGPLTMDVRFDRCPKCGRRGGLAFRTRSKVNTICRSCAHFYEGSVRIERDGSPMFRIYTKPKNWKPKQLNP